MRPEQRHGRAGRLPTIESPLGNISAVPDLFGNQPAVPGKAGHGAQQFLCRGPVAGRQFIVTALAGQYRPGPSYSSPIIRRAIVMLTITVAVIAPPGKTVGRFDFK